MKVQIVEMAGGLLQIVIAGAVLLFAAELGCRIFFAWHEREKESE